MTQEGPATGTTWKRECMERASVARQEGDAGFIGEQSGGKRDSPSGRAGPELNSKRGNAPETFLPKQNVFVACQGSLAENTHDSADKTGCIVTRLCYSVSRVSYVRAFAFHQSDYFLLYLTRIVVSTVEASYLSFLFGYMTRLAQNTLVNLNLHLLQNGQQYSHWLRVTAMTHHQISATNSFSFCPSIDVQSNNYLEAPLWCEIHPTQHTIITGHPSPNRLD